MEFTAQTVAEFLNGSVEGNPEVKVSDVTPIEKGKQGTLSFLANPKYNKFIYETNASIVIVGKDFKAEKDIKPTLIRVDDAYKAFASLLNLYESMIPAKTGIDKNTSIHESAKIGESCYIGDFSYIGENASIGNNVQIYPQVYIGDSVTIGDNCILYPGVKIYKNCKIGNNCIIHGGSVIGSDGFGFAPDNGVYQKIPQLGNVILEDNVEVGSNVSIDRATMGSTILHKGVKIDNLIQIAHNVEVGENTVMAAQVGIAGSTKVGKQCLFGGQVGLAGHINVPDNVKVAAQSGISRSVRKEGSLLFGSPAFDAAKASRSVAVFKNLPDLVKKIAELEKKLNELTENK